ncbi:class I SAM-dependent methyltransferase [Priestia taiwanensis]|uniref:Methyltransferase n=1 Tax=Priestia taiwanensis TaxID=1347902 RepID=A0A917AS29_9BACI|nr:class I SAM-dependent methyltransferase [Priestia taiwanensis]MBM7364039.1 SAM-dependent methyltransferase [Priestia taiwanensis]GGE71150.1 methyltransferase [Priestia taiwanensis]
MFRSYSTLCTEIYDLTKPVGHSLGGDIEYYKERLAGCEGRVLEAAVGSGRMMIPLLEAGYTVDGIDSSSEMLTSCRTRCEKRGLTPHLYEATLQHFSLPFHYEAIIVPTGSFCLLDTYEEALDALQCFHTHLAPGGRLLVDLLLPYDWKTGDITTSTYQLPNGDGIILENKSIEMDWLHQRTVSYLKYEKWCDGSLVQTELQRFALRWYGIEEFKLILKKVGFTNITCSADYIYGQEPSRGDQIITYEAVRK